MFCEVFNCVTSVLRNFAPGVTSSPKKLAQKKTGIRTRHQTEERSQWLHFSRVALSGLEDAVGQDREVVLGDRNERSLRCR